MVDHRAPEGRNAGGDIEAREDAHRGSCEAVDGIGGDLQGQLPAVQHRLCERVRSFGHSLLRALSCCQELLQDHWEQTATTRAFQEVTAVGCFGVLLGRKVFHLLWLQQRAVAQVVGHHDGRIQGREVQSRNGLRVESCAGLEDRGSVELLVGAFRLQSGHHEAALSGLPQQLRLNFDHLSSVQEEVDGRPRHASHLHVVVHAEEFVHQAHGQIGILQAVHSQPPPALGALKEEAPDHTVVHILLLLSQELCRHGIQRVRAQLLLLLDHGEHVEVDPSVDVDFDRLSSAEGVHALSAAVPNQTAQLTEVPADVPRLRPIDEIRQVEILNVVARHHIRIHVLHELTEAQEELFLRLEGIHRCTCDVVAGV
mmetsp:Transcript_38891/g.90034  ORF Transcript_38891/g.90034 Transcript_38891/m.90034 type:complete len:369 (+) Transcript_38891:1261-2367(+)